MSRLRSHARVARVLWVIALGLAIAGTFTLMERLRIGNSMVRRQRWSAWFMKRLSAALPFRVKVSGTLPREPMLWVSNHVSWTDIPLLGMLAPLSFLSKAEVRTWLAGPEGRHAVHSQGLGRQQTYSETNGSAFARQAFSGDLPGRHDH
jgi:hypothetical protein